MKLYLLRQSDNNKFDTFDAVVVCAESVEDAKTIHPDGGIYKEEDHILMTWAISSDSITCEEIGEANSNQKRGVILASFNAG